MSFAGKIGAAVRWRWWYCTTIVGRGVVARLPHFPRVFPACRDMAAYVRAVSSLDLSAPPVSLRVKGVTAGPLLCRPGRSDPWVLWDVFRGGFHRPPCPLRPDCTIVDLGANVGYTAADFASRHPGARVVAVEMDPTNAALAAQNTASFGPRCTVLNAAVWSEDGEISYEGGEEQGYRIADLGDSGPTDRKVAARSIDSIFHQFGLNVVDFLKMDIEGAESVVLAGSLEWAKRVRAMKLEVHAPATVAGCAEILTKAGFRCEKDPNHSHGLIAVR